MQLIRPVWRKQADLLAADTTTFGAALGLKVHLFVNPASPNLDSVLGDFTEATWTAYAALVAGTAPTVTYDVITGNLTLTVQEPAGGWLFLGPVAAPGAPITVYGYYVTDNGSTTLLAAALLDAPVIINAGGQSVDIGDVTLQFSVSSPF